METPWDKRTPSNREMPFLFPETPPSNRPERVVHCAEAVEWLNAQDSLQGCLFTSLPDIGELNLEGDEHLGGVAPSHVTLTSPLEARSAQLVGDTFASFSWPGKRVQGRGWFPQSKAAGDSLNPEPKFPTPKPAIGKEEEYKEWFLSTARLAMEKLKPGRHAIFYQSDIKISPKDGGKKGSCYEWLDKSYLVSKAAEQAGCTLLWRKVTVVQAAPFPPAACCVCPIPHTSHFPSLPFTTSPYPSVPLTTPQTPHRPLCRAFVSRSHHPTIPPSHHHIISSSHHLTIPPPCPSLCQSLSTLNPKP